MQAGIICKPPIGKAYTRSDKWLVPMMEYQIPYFNHGDVVWVNTKSGHVVLQEPIGFLTKIKTKSLDR
jgi:hypothetical protein